MTTAIFLSTASASDIKTLVSTGVATHADAMLEAVLRLPLKDHPIRVLLRPSGDYVNSSERSKFVPAETEQMDRGDIPYFFGFLGGPDIYYFTEPGVAKKVDVFTPEMITKTERSLISPTTLLSEDRVRKIALQSVIMTAFRLMTLLETHELKTSRMTSVITNSTLRVQIDENTIVSQLPYA